MTKRSPKSLKIAFTGKNLTHFGGLYLLQRFFQKLHLRSFSSHYVLFPQRDNRYSVAEEILALLYPILLGLGRIETFHLLKHNGVFQYITGLPTYPNPTTLRRFLLRMAPISLPKLRKLHNKLLLIMILKPKPLTRVIFDLDSTVLVLYGKQEMARIGYNPTKRGRPSYHPLLCFNGITKDFWHRELRHGDTHTATGTIELLIASFAKLPSSVKTIIIRADKGFYDHKTVEFLESKKALFVIVAKLTKPLKGKLSTLSYQKHSRFPLYVILAFWSLGACPEFIEGIIVQERRVSESDRIMDIRTPSIHLINLISPLISTINSESTNFYLLYSHISSLHLNLAIPAPDRFRAGL